MVVPQLEEATRGIQLTLSSASSKQLVVKLYTHRYTDTETDTDRHVVFLSYLTVFA